VQINGELSLFSSLNKWKIAVACWLVQFWENFQKWRAVQILAYTKIRSWRRGYCVLLTSIDFRQTCVRDEIKEIVNSVSKIIEVIFPNFNTLLHYNTKLIRKWFRSEDSIEKYKTRIFSNKNTGLLRRELISIFLFCRNLATSFHFFGFSTFNVF